MTHEPNAEEQEKERKLEEILQEIRVALPGVQILFAFLLTVAFTEPFARLAPASKATYLIALLLAALASVLLIAPTAFHRLQHGHANLDTLIRDATVLAISGTFAMGAALTASTYLVTRVAYRGNTATYVAAAVGAITLLLWVVLPLLRRLTSGE